MTPLQRVENKVNSFDCIIIIQTLQMIFGADRAITILERILKLGGGGAVHLARDDPGRVA
ncbi:hypothetical protein [Sulfitobacter sp. MF3-043]|uniref:hypothetical protein n=1 Tax=Sulfitobacter sediminivivens TaxID=3252902 RepID=UPI0036D863DC